MGTVTSDGPLVVGVGSGAASVVGFGITVGLGSEVAVGLAEVVAVGAVVSIGIDVAPRAMTCEVPKGVNARAVATTRATVHAG